MGFLFALMLAFPVHAQDSFARIIHFDPALDAKAYLIQIFKTEPEYLQVVQQMSVDPKDVDEIRLFANGTSNRAPVSTAGKYGDHEYLTPGGEYRIDYMDPTAISREYNNAPMPWSMFFNHGIAIHGIVASEIPLLGHPASHGCVRMNPNEARILFDFVTKIGMQNFVIQVMGQ